MILTNELRIGNLVMINNKVITMDARIFHAVIHGFEGYEPEPIPLTEEWLIKFGFEKEQGEWCYGGFKLSTYDGVLVFKIMDQIVSYRQIAFVHQLQNLYFALTGEELTIKETV